MPCTIVLKVGTSSIIDEKTHDIRYSLVDGIATTVTELRRVGFKVVIVSSGAVGFGLRQMNFETRPPSLSGKQALAAIGQGEMIAMWSNVFAERGIAVAQILLTQDDVSSTIRYDNAVRTFDELLAMDVVPIVNENDTLSTKEMQIGDNDTLGAITAAMTEASYLFLLTDVDALYTTNPKVDRHAPRIDVVSSVALLKAHLAATHVDLGAGSANGTGGMATKLRAAELASDAGIFTVIASSARPSVVGDILAYYTPARMDRLVTVLGGDGARESFVTDAEWMSAGYGDEEEEEAGGKPRPSHTLFFPSPIHSPAASSPSSRSSSISAW